jgi:hypothetical protein
MTIHCILQAVFVAYVALSLGGVSLVAVGYLGWHVGRIIFSWRV